MSESIATLFGRLNAVIPTSLAVREAMRLSALLKRLPPDARTVLDVGCGDGSFWERFPDRHRIVIDGIDINRHEVRLAATRGLYRNLTICDISQVVPAQTYDVAIGNCSMEHIPGINQALRNLSRCLHPSGKLLLFVPAFGWSRNLCLVRALGRLGTRLEMAVSGALDGFFQHHHLYDSISWCLLVENAGFDVSSCSGLGSPAINRAFEAHLPVAALEFLHKLLFKRYAPTTWQRGRASEALIRELSAQPVDVSDPAVVEYLIEATPVPRATNPA